MTRSSQTPMLLRCRPLFSYSVTKSHPPHGYRAPAFFRELVLDLFDVYIEHSSELADGDAITMFTTRCNVGLVDFLLSDGQDVLFDCVFHAHANRRRWSSLPETRDSALRLSFETDV